MSEKKHQTATKNKAKPKKRKSCLPRLLIIVLLLFLFWDFSNNSLQVTSYSYASSQIPAGFEGYRIVQLSDLHNKVFGKHQKRLVKEVKELSPDIIVITGDVIDTSNHMDEDAAIEFLRLMPQIAPSYYVTGNHETRLPYDKKEHFLSRVAETGVTIMDDIVVPLLKNGSEIKLIGLDDYSLQNDTLPHIMETQDSNDFHILLAHEPQYLEAYYSYTDVDLVFAGHNHGGQFRIPFTHQGVYTISQGLFPKQTEGMERCKNTTMIISRGLGNSAFPFRLFNRPEIVLTTLHCQ